MIDLKNITSLAEIPDGTRFNSENHPTHWIKFGDRWKFAGSDGIERTIDVDCAYLLERCKSGEMFICDSAGNRIEQEPESLEGRKWKHTYSHVEYVVVLGEIRFINEFRKIDAVSKSFTLDSFRAAIASGKLVEIKDEPTPPKDSPDDVCVCGHAMIQHTLEGICRVPACCCVRSAKSEADPIAPQASESESSKQVSFERFTDRARKIMVYANQEAQRFNHQTVGPEHILLGIVKESSGVAVNVLKNLGVDPRRIRLEVEKLIKSGPDIAQLGKLPLTESAKKVIAFSVEEAQALGHNYIGTEHVLLGIIRLPGIPSQVFQSLGLTIDAIRDQAMRFIAPQASESATLEKLATDLSSATDRIAQHVQANLRRDLLVAAMPMLWEKFIGVREDRIQQSIYVSKLVDAVDFFIAELAKREKGAK